MIAGIAKYSYSARAKQFFARWYCHVTGLRPKIIQGPIILLRALKKQDPAMTFLRYYNCMKPILQAPNYSTGSNSKITIFNI